MDDIQDAKVVAEKTEQPTIWKYGNLKVYHTPLLTGCGILLVNSFTKFINTQCRYQSFGRVFEWCAGPAFLGFGMLASGMCDHLVLADINPKSINLVKQTIKENGLEDHVTTYVSDNFTNIPKSEKFDLVIGNPPHYPNINIKHNLGKTYKNDPRASDHDWEIHNAFYNQVGDYLNPGAHLFIIEIEPFKQAVYIPKSDRTPYDTRERLPITEFQDMMVEGGLSYIDARPLQPLIEGVETWVVCSKKPAQIWRRIFMNLNVLK